MNEILAFPELDVSAKKVAPVELSVEELMMESAMDSVGVSSDKSEEAKRELEEYRDHVGKRERRCFRSCSLCHL